jgi:AraC family transcriptional activator of pobA
MEDNRSLPRDFSQHASLPIRLVAPDFGHVSPEVAASDWTAPRLAYYFFLFLWEGTTQVGVDVEQLTVGPQELVFLRPYQLRPLPVPMPGSAYYKLGLPPDCLARLPRSYPFLHHPLRQQKIRFTTPAAIRLRTIFELLRGLLQAPDTEPDLILAQLHSLLTEINAAYFASAPQPAEQGLAQYLKFSVFVEDNFTEHPTIEHIAQALALSTDSLYQLVKQHAGLSPKEFLTQRLILEAKRRLAYQEWTSVKELAYELGFNDPAYFSRLFKKTTGQTVADFFQDLS